MLGDVVRPSVGTTPMSICSMPDGGHATVSASERWDIVRKYYLALPFRIVRNAWRRVRRLYADWWAGR